MFKLHGAALSNYYSIVKLTLLEKGLDFEEVLRAPSQDEDYLALSPMGKIPVLECREGFLSETGVIVDFLEDIYPEIGLFPTDPYKKALVKRICHMAEIYIDLPIRPVVGAMFAGTTLNDEVVASIRQQLEKGLRGLARVAKPGPWLAGAQFSQADIFAYYVLGLVSFIAQNVLKMDVYEYLPGFAEWTAHMAEREFVAEVDAGQKAAMDAFMTSRA